ncbi:hypothetical protein ACFWIJ_34970, partial [Streptomyces sp. NPDC127079]|uniref:hypothetical protein n=1 Tax=Streptomyces sp. NPDC127079 TaxID=3347132 RepID=UPI0036500DD2
RTAARLCDQLERLPLALELAAAQLRSMSLERRVAGADAAGGPPAAAAAARHADVVHILDDGHMQT